MKIPVDVWLRGTDIAHTTSFEGPATAPAQWTEEDVQRVLGGMLREMHRQKHPDASEGTIALRGLSWIVNPYDEGGVVIAIEITLGAAIAGPFEVDKGVLESKITSALAPRTVPTSTRVH
jgi:hypothetical protein